MLFLCQLIPRMSTFDGKSIHLYDMTKNYGNVNNFIGERFFNKVFFLEYYQYNDKFQGHPLRIGLVYRK